MTAPASNQPMFTGEHPRSLDSGLRVNLPKDWRSLQITEFFLISGSAEPYIMVMPRSEYEDKVAEITGAPNLSRAERNTHLRNLGSQCKRVTIDSSGRIAVPTDICKALKLAADNADVMLVGAVRSFEIWNPNGYEKWTRKQSAPGKQGAAHSGLKEFLGVL